MQINCSVCGPKDIKHFYKNKSGKHGVRSVCKDCMRTNRQKKAREELRQIYDILSSNIEKGVI